LSTVPTAPATLVYESTGKPVPPVTPPENDGAWNRCHTPDPY
jgi:hypothetical protein